MHIDKIKSNNLLGEDRVSEFRCFHVRIVARDRSESSKDVLCDRASTCVQVRHDFSSGPPEETPCSKPRPGGGLQSSVDGTTGGISCGLWEHPQRNQVHRHVDKPPKLDSMVCKPLCKQWKAQSSEDDLRSSPSRSRGASWRGLRSLAPSDRKRSQRP